MALTVTLEQVAIARGPRCLAAGLTLTLAPGTVTVLAGPNGAGKSTLLDCLAGELAPASGTLCYSGQPLHDLALGQRAMLRTMLRQKSDIAFDFPVADIVAMGLHPHGIGSRTAQGIALVARALTDLDLLPLAARPATRLSGGEAQRVQLARALVQLRAAAVHGAGGLLLLDEPTTGLDYRHQLALLRLVRAEAAAGATIVVSLHDLPLALRLADRLLFLGHGRLVADLAPHTIGPDLIAGLYGIPAHEACVLLQQTFPFAAAAE